MEEEDSLCTSKDKHEYNSKYEIILGYLKRGIFKNNSYVCAYNRIKSCNCISMDYCLYIGNAFNKLLNVSGQTDEKDVVKYLTCNINPNYISYEKINISGLDDIEFYSPLSLNNEGYDVSDLTSVDPMKNLYSMLFLQYCLYVENFFSDNDQLKEEAVEVFFDLLFYNETRKNETESIHDKIGIRLKKLTDIKDIPRSIAEVFYLESQDAHYSKTFSICLMFLATIFLNQAQNRQLKTELENMVKIMIKNIYNATRTIKTKH